MTTPCSRLAGTLALLALLANPEPAMTQTPPPAAAPADDTPALLDALRRGNAAIRRFTLPNGLTVLLRESHAAPMAAIQYWVASGSIHEGDRLGAGLSHYLEHMLFKGTATRGPGQVSREIADVGGDINAYTANDRTVYHCSLPAAAWRTGLDVLTDAVFHPSFPEEEWLREREVVLREVAMGEDDPGRVISKCLWETLFRENPYRAPIIGWKDILVTMTRDDLADYHARHYSPDNIILSIAADVPLAEMESAVRSLLASVPRTPVPPVYIPAEPPQTAERTFRQTGPYQITRLVLAYHTPPLAHPDTPALDLLADALGDGRSSPLVRRLREESALALDIDASNYTPRDIGVFSVFAECDPGNETALVEAIRREIERVRTEPFDPARLETVRRTVLRDALRNLATLEGQAAEMASGEFYHHDPAADERYLAAIASITPEDLLRVARQYLTPENATWVFLSPETAGSAPAATVPDSPPRVTLHAYPNGLRLVHRHDPRLPFAHLSIVVGGGLLAEPEGQAGATRLASRLLVRGTPAFTAAQIADLLESRAATLEPFSGRNSYGLNATALSADFPLLLQTAADCLLSPTFPPDEFEKERARQLADIRAADERPMTHAQRLARTALFPGHPYRFTPDGTPETLASLTPRTLAAFHRSLLSPSNIVVAVFGDVTEADALSAVATHLASRLPDAPPPPPPPPLPPPPSADATLETKVPAAQTIYLRAFPARLGPANPRDDAILALVVDSLNGLSSDLFDEIRDKRGLAYYTGALHLSGPVGSHLYLYAGTTDPAYPEVARLVQTQLARLAADGLRPD